MTLLVMEVSLYIEDISNFTISFSTHKFYICVVNSISTQRSMQQFARANKTCTRNIHHRTSPASILLLMFFQSFTTLQYTAQSCNDCSRMGLKLAPGLVVLVP